MGFFSTSVKPEEVMQIGKPLLIDVSDPELAGVYKSTIFDIDYSKKVIKIGMPSYKGSFVPLPAGTRLYVKMLSKSSMYVFQSILISYKKDDEGFLVSFISLPETVRRIQRRDFVRVPFFREGKIFRLLDNTEYPFFSKDLSAGGLLIITGVTMKVSEEVFIYINIDDDITIEKQSSEIVRHDPNSTVKNCGYGVKFKSLPRFLEDRLVRFVFKLEQKIKENSGEEGKP